MPIETRSNSALFRRAEQLKRWEQSETNNIPACAPTDKKNKIQFSDGCVFLAACAASDTEEVERLLALGTDINTANVDGLTALHQACIDNNLEMVQFLVNHQCDVNRGDNEGWTPLHATASCGFLSIAKFLIENGANVAAVNNDGDLPIDITESSEMEEYLSDVLDEKEIDCDEARSEEERIMMEDAKLILANSIDVNEKIHPRTGATALHVAAAKGYCEVMKILIQADVDLNAQDNDGWTSLHAAAHWSQKDACTLLAENLANMDIQNVAGQTCFDVADKDMIAFLQALKKKQASMQKERPEIKEILQRTSNRPPLKRRTSVTRMSGQEKSKSVMKDTKSERAQIESMSLPEEENDEEKKQNVSIELINKSPAKPPSQEPKTEPKWKKVVRRASQEKEEMEADVSEVIIKRPKKLNDDVKEKDEETVNVDKRPSIPPVRDEESELQRKAHAKRVRETRRSTQGVLLEDLKSAELQLLRNSQQEAALRQAQEAQNEPPLDGCSESENSSNVQSRSVKNNRESSDDISREYGSHSSRSEKSELSDAGSKSPSSPGSETEPSVTVMLRPKNASSPDDISPSETKSSFGTQAAIQRRRRPKRRSTGVVYLEGEDGPEEKEGANDKDAKTSPESSHSDRPRHRYGSSTSIPDSASDVSSQGENFSEEEIKEYKKLYEEMVNENTKLKETLKQANEELEKNKKLLQRLNQGNAIKNSASEAEKKERRSLERKLSEMEEELKQIEKFRADNDRLKEENAALIRVISKISHVDLLLPGLQPNKKIEELDVYSNDWAEKWLSEVKDDDFPINQEMQMDVYSNDFVEKWMSEVKDLEDDESLRKRLTHKCDVCEKQFTCRQNLKRRIKSHQPSQSYTCRVCSKTYARKDNLKRHEKFHINTPNQQKSVGQHEDLAVPGPSHLNVLNGPLVQGGNLPINKGSVLSESSNIWCQICKKIFKSKHNLNRHMKSTHLKLDRKTCALCKKEFHRNDKYNDHVKICSKRKAQDSRDSKKIFKKI
ncbi:hypothetical protein JTE90_026440 [Oedothorax gibbosus]|uniref:Protein phosphatase 1 regulatory subunit 12B n=1 Tax=Oedothorax gibbosus TaxID=931172 RepID=A0AAV6VNW3_9ARAC|nr:hypothetical protein JTE90_026440 [Oedothorax gibbosus]